MTCVSWLQLLGSAQNILILNLAVSNVLLCVVTMPLNLVNIIHNFWVLGGGQVSCDWWSWSHNTQYSSLIGQEVLCRLSGSSQSTFVMFSSLSVVMIAVDRYNIIINDRSVSIKY